MCKGINGKTCTNMDIVSDGLCQKCLDIKNSKKELKKGEKTGVKTGKDCPIHTILEVQEITFSGNHTVKKDTLGDFDSTEWIKGRKSPQILSQLQSPVCYTRNKKVKIKAKFEVTTKPSKAETVKIKGKGVFDGKTLEWESDVNVTPSSKEVTTSEMESNKTLPDKVACYDTANIVWQMNPAKTGWSGAGNSQHLFYVTLGDPTGTPAYWTLLDVSCRAANGQTSEQKVVSKVFEPLKASIGDGKGIKRKWDDTKLTYWKPGNTKATNTQQLLAQSDGSGQCGSWAEFLIDMYKVHGINTGHKVIVEVNKTLAPSGYFFLVKNWIFNEPPISTPDSFTHKRGIECVEATGIPGQGNDNPNSVFANHFIVKSLTTKKLYDPSYGAGPFSNKKEWEKAAIDGLSDKNTPRMAGYHKDKRKDTEPVLLTYRDQVTHKNL